MTGGASDLGLVAYTAISHPFAPHLDRFVFGGPAGDNVFLLWALSILGLPVVACETRETDQRGP